MSSRQNWKHVAAIFKDCRDRVEAIAKTIDHLADIVDKHDGDRAVSTELFSVTSALDGVGAVLDRKIEEVEQKAAEDGSMLIRTWPSSKPGKSYELRMGSDGIVYCSCPAWKFSRAQPKSCKHMVEWAETIARNGQAFVDRK